MPTLLFTASSRESERLVTKQSTLRRGFKVSLRDEFTVKDRFLRPSPCFRSMTISCGSGTSIQAHQQLPPAPTLHFWPYDIFPKIGPFHQVSPFSTRPSLHPLPPTPTVFSPASDLLHSPFRWILFRFQVDTPFFLGTPATVADEELGSLRFCTIERFFEEFVYRNGRRS